MKVRPGVLLLVFTKVEGGKKEKDKTLQHRKVKQSRWTVISKGLVCKLLFCDIYISADDFMNEFVDETKSWHMPIS